MFGMGPWEIGIIIAVLILLFGPKRLPALARGVGSSLTEFKRGVAGVKEGISEAEEEIRSAGRTAEKAVKDIG